MKLLFKVLAIGLLPSLCTAKEGTPSVKSGQSKAFLFMENKGQITDQNYKVRNDIDFNLQSKGFVVFAGDAQLHYQFSRIDNMDAINKHMEAQRRDPVNNQKDVLPTTTSYRVDVELLGANKDAQIVTEDRSEYYEIYHNEATPNGGTANGYGKVIYKDVYPNIDWVLYSKNGQFKYEFIVRQGGNPANIQLKYSGASSLNVDKHGSLTINTPLGNITDDMPVSFDGAGRKVNTSFSLKGDVLSFNLASYDGQLTIDPTVTWGTYYGGNSDDYSFAVAAMPDGSASYMTGYTYSSVNMATTGSHQSTWQSSYDAFVVKFNSAGVRQWGTYYGGTGTEYGYGIALDASGNVYFGGYTTTTTANIIATSGTQQLTISGTPDGFLVKMNSSGVRQWGTHCGGSGYDVVYSVACDVFGSVYIGGYTQSSTQISSPFAQQPTYAGTDGFVVKYFPATGLRDWGTYYGGANTDYIYGIACDASGNLLATGYTYSTNNINSTGAYQTTINTDGNTSYSDAFIVKLNNAQGVRTWGTYVGGSYGDNGYSIAIGDSNAVWMLGNTSSSNAIATTDGFQTTISGTPDAFLVKFDSAGARKYGTYYGGSSSEYFLNCNSLAVDINNNVYMGGYTYSSNNIASGGVNNSYSNTDGFIVKMKPDGTRDWGSYYGGTSTDYVGGIAVDQLGYVYACGYTQSSSNIATSGSHQPSWYSSWDGYLVKILDCALPLQPGTITGNTSVCQNSTQTYSIAAVTGATTYQWILPPGWVGTSTTNSITVTPSGTSGTIRVKAGVACGYGPARTLAVTAIAAPPSVITPSGPTTFCQNANVTLTANTGTGYTYVWKQGTTTLSTTTNAHVASTSGLYTVLITNTNNCTTTSPAVSVIVNPNPVINFPSLAATCTNNANVTLMATPTGGTYTGAGITGNVFHPLTAGAGIHTLVYSFTDSNTCTSSANQSVTVNPSPVVNFPAFSTICSDVVVPLNMATPPGGVYSGTGVTNTPSFNPGISGIGTFNITYVYTDGNNCAASGTQPITVNPLTATNFPSLSPRCVDAPVVNLSATPFGGTFSGPGVTGSQFNPATGPGSHIIHYDLTNGFGCTTHDSETIVVNPLPTLVFPAMDSVCDNASFTMLATPAGGTYTGPGTGVGNTLNTQQAGLGTHTITYTYTDNNTCTNSTSQTVLIQPQPVITTQPYLYTEVCEGEAIAVNVGTMNADSFQWMQNSVNIAGAYSNTYVIGSSVPANSGNYNVLVYGVGACNSTYIMSNASAILVNPLPAINLTPGSTAICSGDSITLNSGLTMGMTYQWKMNGQNIAGATSATYQASTTGVYNVKVTNQNSGCDASSPTMTLTVNPSPVATISYTGPTTFCQGDDLMVTTSDTNNSMTYQWMNSGNNIGGATSADYTANATGVYSVVMTNMYNCSRTSDTVAVTVNPLPTPTITVLDAFGKMTTGTFTTYQWNLNGNPIAGATSQEYQATTSGNYSVTVTDANGCENTSSDRNPTAVSNIVNGNSTFVLYPNPNAGTFSIDGTITSTDNKAAIEIVDVTGKLVYRDEVKTISDKLNTQINISGVAAGAYMIRIVSDNAKEVIPFVKR